MTQKGKMARHLVYFCLAILTLSAIWALIIHTIAVFHDNGMIIDLSAPLTFIGATFGGELLMLLIKRIFAKPNNMEEDE